MSDHYGVLKAFVEAGLALRLPEADPKFKFLIDEEWEGLCPNPCPKCIETHLTIPSHMTDCTRVCLDCHAIHLVLPTESESLMEIVELIEKIATEYPGHKH